MNAEIQVYVFVHRVAPGNSQFARRENVAARSIAWKFS